MIDRERMLQREDQPSKDIREWQAKESAENRKQHFREFLVVVVALIIIVVASVLRALIERGGQPTVNIVQMPISTPLSTSDTGETPP